MLKTLQAALKEDKERFFIPKSVQDTIPINAVYPDGVFYVGHTYFSKTFHFTDINYSIAAPEEQENIFFGYSALLNSLDAGKTAKLTLIKHPVRDVSFQQSILLPLRQDKLDKYRSEINSMLTDKLTNDNAMTIDKYITLSTAEKKTVEDAHTYFQRTSADLSALFSRLGSRCVELNANERVKLFFDLFRPEEADHFHFDLSDTMRKGHDIRDYICPDTFENFRDYFRIGEQFGRVLFLREYANSLSDKFVSELLSLNRNLILSIDIIPIPLNEAVKEGEKRLLGVEKNITTWQMSQNKNNNFSAVVPLNMENQREECREFLSDLTERDQRMFCCVLTLAHLADSKEQLDADTEALQAAAQQGPCQLAVLKYQQLDGLQTALPYGTRKINALRTLTTESLAVFMPFQVQEVRHRGGQYVGQNKESGNMICVNRENLQNGNQIICGVSGSGKSMTAKLDMADHILSEDADILIIDPEREYTRLVKALGGEVIFISATGSTHINAMELNRNYGQGADPIMLKSDFLLSLCDQISGVAASSKSIIDRCTAEVYRDYQRKNYKGKPPTLRDFRQILLQQPEKEAKDIALNLELFTDGSLNTFAKQTNVNTNNRLICYDILELGKHLQPVGMLVVLDSILNRITANRAKGRKTYIYIDEMYLLFLHEYSSEFLYTLWKRVRKYNAFCIGITQNIEDMLQSYTARTMFSNSEYVTMLNQSGPDCERLAEVLGISENQMHYISNVPAGQGLLKIGGSLIPFSNEFPKDTELYRLMTTKPSDLQGGKHEKH